MSVWSTASTPLRGGGGGAGKITNGFVENNMVPPNGDINSHRIRGTSQDLFELLERVQCSRLDDQRCVLPPYFSQVSFIFLIFFQVCFF